MDDTAMFNENAEYHINNAGIFTRGCEYDILYNNEAKTSCLSITTINNNANANEIYNDSECNRLI